MNAARFFGEPWGVGGGAFVGPPQASPLIIIGLRGHDQID